MFTREHIAPRNDKRYVFRHDRGRVREPVVFEWSLSADCAGTRKRRQSGVGAIVAAVIVPPHKGGCDERF